MTDDTFIPENSSLSGIYSQINDNFYRDLHETKL